MPVSEHDVQTLQQVRLAKAAGIERRTRVDLLKRTWKTSIWFKEDDEEMPLHHRLTHLVYTLYYVQQGRQDWEDKLSRETMGRMKKHEKGKDNLHAEEDFAERLRRINLILISVSTSRNIRRFFERWPHPLSCKRLIQMYHKLKPKFERSVVRQGPCPAQQNQNEEMERQMHQCIGAGLVEEYNHGDNQSRCSACFLVAKYGSTANHLFIDNCGVNIKTQNISGSISNMENIPEKIAKC